MKIMKTPRFKIALVMSVLFIMSLQISATAFAVGEPATLPPGTGITPSFTGLDSGWIHAGDVTVDFILNILNTAQICLPGADAPECNPVGKVLGIDDLGNLTWLDNGTGTGTVTGTGDFIWKAVTVPIGGDPAPVGALKNEYLGATVGGIDTATGSGALAPTNEKLFVVNGTVGINGQISDINDNSFPNALYFTQGLFGGNDNLSINGYIGAASSVDGNNNVTGNFIGLGAGSIPLHIGDPGSRPPLVIAKDATDPDPEKGKINVYVATDQGDRVGIGFWGATLPSKLTVADNSSDYSTSISNTGTGTNAGGALKADSFNPDYSAKIINNNNGAFGGGLNVVATNNVSTSGVDAFIKNYVKYVFSAGLNTQYSIKDEFTRIKDFLVVAKKYCWSCPNNGASCKPKDYVEDTVCENKIDGLISWLVGFGTEFSTFTPILNATGAGNVGINKFLPLVALDVRSKNRSTVVDFLNYFLNDGAVTVARIGAGEGFEDVGAAVVLGNDITDHARIRTGHQLLDGGLFAGNLYFDVMNGLFNGWRNVMTLTNKGRVGIDNATPRAKLDIYTDTTGRGDGHGELQDGIIFTSWDSLFGAIAGANDFSMAGIWPDKKASRLLQGPAGELVFGTNDYDLFGNEGIEEKMRITQDGDLRIGNSNDALGLLPPKLNVIGTGNRAGVALRNTDANGAEWRITSYQDGKLLFWGDADKNGSGTDFMSITPNGNVGIGVTEPVGRLSIQGEENDISTVAGGIEFRRKHSSGEEWSRAGIWAEGWANGGNKANGDLVFGTDGDGTQNNNVTEKMRVTAKGNVIVGVAGSVAAHGALLTVSGADDNTAIGLTRTDTNGGEFKIVSDVDKGTSPTLRFFSDNNKDGNNLVEVMTMASGNTSSPLVGIENPSPTSTLQVGDPLGTQSYLQIDTVAEASLSTADCTGGWSGRMILVMPTKDADVPYLAVCTRNNAGTDAHWRKAFLIQPE